MKGTGISNPDASAGGDVLGDIARVSEGNTDSHISNSNKPDNDCENSGFGK